MNVILNHLELFLHFYSIFLKNIHMKHFLYFYQYVNYLRKIRPIRFNINISSNIKTICFENLIICSLNELTAVHGKSIFCYNWVVVGKFQTGANCNWTSRALNQNSYFQRNTRYQWIWKICHICPKRQNQMNNICPYAPSKAVI
jgi:hypothetical protein